MKNIPQAPQTDRAVFQNAGWIVGCRIIQALLSLLVGMQTARYLGPSNYGLISYAASVTAFFIPVMQLGLRSTLVRELVDAPEQEGQTLGTALMMNLISGAACVVGISAFAAAANRGEGDTILVCVLYGTSLIFQASELLQYWFQAKLLSKYTAMVSTAAYAAASLYKLLLLITKKSVYWFAAAQLLDYGIIAAALLILYRRKGAQKLRVSLRRGRELLRLSRYYILSGLMVTVFAHTDSVMLKLMLGEAATGLYTAAVTLATCTGFVFGALIDSMRPVILESRRISREAFEAQLKRLVSAVVWLSLAQCVLLTALAEPLMVFLYGEAYRAAAGTLRLLIWYSTFSYLGAVRNVWILAEGRQKRLWIVNLTGAAGNVLLNWLLIPRLGLHGAAVASVAAQFLANVAMGWLIPDHRPWQRLLLRGLDPRYGLRLASSFLTHTKSEVSYE